MKYQTEESPALLQTCETNLSCFLKESYSVLFYQSLYSCYQILLSYWVFRLTSFVPFLHFHWSPALKSKPCQISHGRRCRFLFRGRGRRLTLGLTRRDLGLGWWDHPLLRMECPDIRNTRSSGRQLKVCSLGLGIGWESSSQWHSPLSRHLALFS